MSTSKKEELYRRGYNFIVYLEGKQIPFQRVSGLADQGSFETLAGRRPQQCGVQP